RQSIDLIVGRPILNRKVATFNQAGFFQALLKARFAGHGRAAQIHNHRHGLLRARDNRPRGRSAAEKRDERAPAAHSITSSAATSSVCGTVRPSIRAVERLMTSSNFDDCTTGRSAGFVPLRTWPT